jgi:hypothetical protein
VKIWQKLMAMRSALSILSVSAATLLVPSMLYRLLEAPEALESDLSSLQAVYYGARCVKIAGEIPTIYQVWRKHETDPGFWEELMLAVAKLNDCR